MGRIVVCRQIGGRVKQYCHRFSNISRQTWIFIGELVVLFLLCFLHAASAGHYANFTPINGTFQNYNPVRRLLGGQIPYQDFQDYLGLGHLYLGSFFTFLLGGSYRDSLIAFSLLNFGSLALISYVVGMAVFGKKEMAVTVTNIILSCLLIQPDFFVDDWTGGAAAIIAALASALKVGISARFIRGMILPVICLLLWGAYLCYNKVGLKNSWVIKYKESVTYAGIGFLGGFAFAWSNDYGISCWLCLAIMSFWISLFRTGRITKVLKNVVMELAASLVGLLVTVEILTWGNLSEWISFTFGSGGYQRWYYNSAAKSYYVTDVDFSWLMMIQAGICIAYIIRLFQEKASVNAIRRYGLPAFCNMVGFCVVNEYKLLSGGTCREVALATLFLTILYEIVRFLSSSDRRQKEEKTAVLVSLVVGAAWIVSDAKDEFEFRYLTEKEGIYVESMGGNLTSYGEDLIRTKEFLDGEKFFATYASAQEVVSDIYQPSGIDYIIHVLGDAQRENYLNAFHSADFKYAATIKDSYSDWMYWAERANWFWHRELYENWHPVYANTYEVYWEKNEITDNESLIEDGFSIDIMEAGDGIKIAIQTEEAVNGIADVYIDYCVYKSDSRRAKLVFQTLLRAQNTGEIYASNPERDANNLRPQSQEYIPIPIVNGYGEVTLSSAPEKSTYLEINEISCSRIFTCTSDYIEIADISAGNQETVLRISNTKRNRNALAGISAIEIQDHIYAINSIDETLDDDFMALYVNDDIDYEENKSNIMRIIRDENKR